MSAKNRKLELPKPLTLKQSDLIKAILDKEMVITVGPAGTGKSFIPAAMAAWFYSHQKVDKIILTRPTVPVGKGIGFFPGTLEEKLEPWTLPFIMVLEEHLSKGEVDCMFKNGKIEVVPFETIRGHTFNDAFVVLDEAQNTTVPEFKAFVTRIGQRTKTVINGDILQSDLKGNDISGLEFGLNLLKQVKNIELQAKVGLVSFDYNDIVRSDLCKAWVKAFPHGYQ